MILRAAVGVAVLSGLVALCLLALGNVFLDARSDLHFLRRFRTTGFASRQHPIDEVQVAFVGKVVGGDTVTAPSGRSCFFWALRAQREGGKGDEPPFLCASERAGELLLEDRWGTKFSARDHGLALRRYLRSNPLTRRQAEYPGQPGSSCRQITAAPAIDEGTYTIEEWCLQAGDPIEVRASHSSLMWGDGQPLPLRVYSPSTRLVAPPQGEVEVALAEEVRRFLWVPFSFGLLLLGALWAVHRIGRDTIEERDL